MLLVHTSAAQFKHLAPERLQWPKVKLLLAVVPPAHCGGAAGLQPVGSDDFSARLVLGQQVIPKFIERTRIQAGHKGFRQAFIQLEVKDGEAQFLSSPDVCRIAREPCDVGACRPSKQARRFELYEHRAFLNPADYPPLWVG